MTTDSSYFQDIRGSKSVKKKKKNILDPILIYFTSDFKLTACEFQIRPISYDFRDEKDIYVILVGKLSISVNVLQEETLVNLFLVLWSYHPAPCLHM